MQGNIVELNPNEVEIVTGGISRPTIQQLSAQQASVNLTATMQPIRQSVATSQSAQTSTLSIRESLSAELNMTLSALQRP